MNYKKIHDLIIERGKSRDPIGYTEVHHIIPRCLGGNNSQDNLVRLTPEEHYVVHQLLVKIYPENNKLVYAAHRMCTGKFRNNKLYGWLRRKHASTIGTHTSKVGKDNSQYNTIWITDGYHTKKIKNDDTIPEGWKKGRTFTGDAKKNISWAKGKKIDRTHKPFLGLNHSDETKQRMSLHSKSRYMITNGSVNRHHHKEHPIPEGWWRGITRNIN